jgi:hypothetical protein
LNDSLNDCQVEVGTKMQGLLINLSAPANEDSSGLRLQVNLAKIGNGPNPRVMELTATENDGSAVWQWPANGFKRLAPHHEHLASGHFFEPLKILRQVPGDSSPIPNHAIEGHGRDRTEVFHVSGARSGNGKGGFIGA